MSDASELLEFGKEALDQIAIAVLVLAECPLIFSVCFRRNDGLGVFAVDIREQRISVVSFVGQDRAWLHLLYQCLCLCYVGDLSAGEREARQLAQPFDTGMDLGRQTAPRTSQGLFTLLFGSPGSMLMSPHYGAVDQDFFEVGILTQDRKDVLSDILIGPAGKANINAVPWTKCCWKITSCAASACNPQRRFNEAAISHAAPAPVDKPFPAKAF